MAEWAPPQIVWGCDPARQLECRWLEHLLGCGQQFPAWDQPPPPLPRPGPLILVESGLLRLERAPGARRLEGLRQARAERLAVLAGLGPFGVIHLSDEEGLDGDALYPQLPPGTVVWRNFPYPRFPNARVFPIGPRAEFLEASLAVAAAVPASSRAYPWAFMGTLWSSGSRTLAASLFLRALPQGFFFGGSRFGQGLPPRAYRQQLLASAFALCPEGDRHLDTFRLYESLQAGCIPVLVDQRAMASALLGPHTVLPVFASWPQALCWVRQLLADPVELDATQARVGAWWRQHRGALAGAMRHTLIGPAC